jgi:2-methylaconitate cis-trans-isomerase PrpF
MVAVFQSLAATGTVNVASATALERTMALNFIDEISSEVAISLAALGPVCAGLPVITDFIRMS